MQVVHLLVGWSGCFGHEFVTFANLISQHWLQRGKQEAQKRNLPKKDDDIIVVAVSKEALAEVSNGGGGGGEGFCGGNGGNGGDNGRE